MHLLSGGGASHPPPALVPIEDGSVLPLLLALLAQGTEICAADLTRCLVPPDSFSVQPACA